MLSRAFRAIRVSDKTQTSDPELQQAYLEGRHMLYQLQADDDFVEALAAEGLTTHANQQPEYWEVVANYATQITRLDRQHGVAERQTLLNELMAATPDFVYKSLELASHHHMQDREEAHYFIES